MLHRTHDGIAEVARIHDADWSSKPMSQVDRLRRWLDLLRADPNRILQTLYETEYRSASGRDAMRGEHTAITVAFEDPVLRAEGLKGDTYGDAKRFFGLSDDDLHFALCYCHGGPAMSAGTAARRVEGCLPQLRGPSLFRRVMTAFAR